MKSTATATGVIEAVRVVEASAADPEVRVVRRIEVGQAIQQGDVYLHRVADDHPRGKQVGIESVQIALGTGSGARHVAEGAVRVYAGTTLPPGVSAPANVGDREICGPMVIADEPWTLTHPEHPHHRLPAGSYQTTYQYDSQTMRRVQD
jgi:hypothetical protein